MKTLTIISLLLSIQTVFASGKFDDLDWQCKSAAGCPDQRKYPKTKSKKWPPSQKNCPDPGTPTFSLITEHSIGTDGIVSCKHFSGDTYKYKDKELKYGDVNYAEYFQCDPNEYPVGSLLLTQVVYHKSMDKIGNIHCSQGSKILKFIGVLEN